MSLALHPRPAMGTPAPWDFPDCTRIELPNGMAALLCHLPGRPVLHAQVVFPGGARLEDAAHAGAGTVLATALSEGGDDRAVALESFGAAFAARLRWDALELLVTAPADGFRRVLDVLTELVADPGLADDDVARVQRRHHTSLSVQWCGPPYRAATAFSEAAFEAGTRHACMLAGTPAGLRATDAGYIRALWERMFDPTRATVVVAGDLAGGGVPDGLAATLGLWRNPPCVGYPDVAATRPARAGTLGLVDLPDAVQTNLVVGGVLPAVAPGERPAVEAAVHYLGGFLGSRLSSRIREGLAASYGATATIEHLGDCSVLRMASAVATPSTAAVAEVMLAELAEVRAGRVDPDTAAAAVCNLVAGAVVRYAGPAAVAGTLARIVAEGLPVDYSIDRQRALRALTADDMADAMARCTADLAVCGVAAGPADEVRGPLGALGFEVVA